MKNHFFIPYSGNKRNEVNKIYDNIKIQSNINTIIEPYCGTAAMSYYIWSLNKNKNYNYVLNDNNNYLTELYNVAKNPVKLLKLPPVNKRASCFCSVLEAFNWSFPFSVNPTFPDLY